VSDIYKFAAQNRLRFPSPLAGGGLTVEQLFQLPLRSETGASDLNTVAKTINAELNTSKEEDFVGDETLTPAKERLTIALDIVKDVIKTKQDANKAAREQSDRLAQKRKILDLISQKKDEKLSSQSIEDLEKQLAELK
jgi:hypothetical protein